MVKVSATEFSKNVGHYHDLALSQPVTVTRNGRDRTVTISAAEYHWLKRRDREALTLDDFTADDLRAIRAAQSADSSEAFDPELG